MTYPVDGPRVVTQAFGARPEVYAQYGFPGHEGVDLQAAFATPVRAVASGHVSKITTTGNYGNRIDVLHDGGWQTTYAHLDKFAGLPLGAAVIAGQIIGYAGSTGNSTGVHLHLGLKRDGYTYTDSKGQVWPFNLHDPTPYLAPFLPAAGIDLLSFKLAHPDCWRVVKMTRPDGSQHTEDVQDMELGGGLFVRRKNDNGEWHKYDGQYFYLVHDTSPDKGTEGIPRCYTLYKYGKPGAPKSKRFQAVGEMWYESGTHKVEFQAKSDCRYLAENSGDAANKSVITKHEFNYTFNKFGQNLKFDEVIFEQTGLETQIYARLNGKSCGWIGWSSPWGFSEPVEIHWNRGRMTVEPKRWCSW